jgi:integrase
MEGLRMFAQVALDFDKRSRAKG